jgi:cardiolipin synthase
MNVREGHVLALGSAAPVQDIHFRIEGPVVSHLQDVFCEDWTFTTGEQLQGPLWFPELSNAGTVIARGIVDGPDEDCDKTVRTILCALACAQSSVKILTPYFLPSPTVISALNTTASRGVAVDIILPRENNLRWVGWAMMAQLWQVLEWGCHVWCTPPPFDHSKLLLVDDEWSLVGSANWDARSLRLNFEFNVECYCPDLARSLGAIFEQKRAGAQRIRLEDVDKRSSLVKLRDSFARLFTPYL